MMISGIYGMIVQTVLGAVSVLLLPYFVKGIEAKGFKPAIKLVLLITCVNFILDILFWWILVPLKFLSLGLSRFILNGLILDFSSDFISGVKCDSIKSAIIGGITLSIIWTVLSWLFA
ncbi:MAG: phage holin family protein [Candidatus Riflebacteria bacterium]|nr:phage holin family protein [Candidatus Riflebacteria bacterium]